MRRIFLGISGLLLIALFLGAVVVLTPVQAQVTGTGWVGSFYNNTSLSGTPVASNIS